MSWFRKKPPELPAPATLPGDLREFVYLDDVSVNSLLASRFGPLASQHTDRQDLAWQVGGKAAATYKHVLSPVGGQLEASVARNSSRGSQIVSNEVIQAAFKKLVECERTNLLISPRLQGDSARKTSLVSSDITRGRLIEVDVELDVEPIYRMSTVVSALVGLIDKNPTLFGEIVGENFSQGRAIGELLNGILGGLVPIRARVEDYGIAVQGAQLELVEKSTGEGAHVQPLYLVGVAEEKLFWKDIRRILFSKGRYRVLARIAQTGILENWVPVKLAHVIESVVPDFGRTISQLGLDTLNRSGGGQSKVSSVAEPLGPLLKAFQHVYLEAHCPSQTERSRERCAEVIKEFENVPFELPVYRAACNSIVDAMLEPHEKPSSEELNRLRTLARKASSSLDTDAGSSPLADRYLDCEIIAIYW